MAVSDDLILTDKTRHWPSILRHYRFTHNMKQAALAHDLGVTQAMVSRWESGAVQPGQVMQNRILELFDTYPTGTPMIGWREFIACHPAMGAVVNRDGIAETVSEGALREFGVQRHEIEGRSIVDLFEGDFLTLFTTLKSRGFFEGGVEGAESADELRLRLPNGWVRTLYGHGMHWPREGEDGRVRWIASGAAVDEHEFASVRSDLGGQIEIIST